MMATLELHPDVFSDELEMHRYMREHISKGDTLFITAGDEKLEINAENWEKVFESLSIVFHLRGERDDLPPGEYAYDD